MIDPLDQLNNPTALTLEAPITQYLRPDGRKRPALLSATGGSSIATMRNKKAPKSEKHPCIK